MTSQDGKYGIWMDRNWLCDGNGTYKVHKDQNAGMELLKNKILFKSLDITLFALKNKKWKIDMVM